MAREVLISKKHTREKMLEINKKKGSLDKETMRHLETYYLLK